MLDVISNLSHLVFLFKGNNGTFIMFIEGDRGIFDVTPPKGINEATFLVRVKDSTKLDYEKTKGGYLLDRHEHMFQYSIYKIPSCNKIIYIFSSDEFYLSCQRNCT